MELLTLILVDIAVAAVSEVAAAVPVPVFVPVPVPVPVVVAAVSEGPVVAGLVDASGGEEVGVPEVFDCPVPFN